MGTFFAAEKWEKSIIVFVALIGFDTKTKAYNNLLVSYEHIHTFKHTYICTYIIYN